MPLRIIHRDDHITVIEKPAGFHVHPPQDGHRIAPQWNTLGILRDQTGETVWPIHRLDRPTSGLLVFGRTPEAAGRMAELFRNREVQKTYYALVRGWPEPSRFTVDRPLSGKKPGSSSRDAHTDFEVVGRLELPFVTQPQFATTRLALVRCAPHTGRFHQIRRHLSSTHHPLVGDAVHGDSKFNRAFRDHWGVEGLWLKAYRLEFTHPWNEQRLRLRSTWTGRWHKLFDATGVCPIG